VKRAERNQLIMYTNQAFSSGSYAEMMSGTHLIPHEYGESVGGQNEVKFIKALGDAVTMQSLNGHSNAATCDPACNSYAGDSNIVPRTQMGMVDGEQNMQCQGLSLSLGTRMPSTASVSPFQFQYHDTGLLPLMTDFSNLKGTMSLKDDEANNLREDFRSDGCMGSVSSGGFHEIIKRESFYNPHPSMSLKEVPWDQPGYSNSILNSQYLRAAQELLDEIVSVRKALKQPGMEKQENNRDIGLDGSKNSDAKSTQTSSGPGGSTANASSELSSAERQNLLDKKTKLLSMLDEVVSITPNF